MTRPPAAAATSARTSVGSGSVSSSGGWAPHHFGASHGPSRWIPASSPAPTRGARDRTCRSSRSIVSVTRLATTVVVPSRRCAARAARAASAPSANAAPPPPWLWMSTNPGTSTSYASPASAPDGGSPSPTPRIRSPAKLTQPSASCWSGVMTRAARTTRTCCTHPPRRSAEPLTPQALPLRHPLTRRVPTRLDRLPGLVEVGDVHSLDGGVEQDVRLVEGEPRHGQLGLHHVDGPHELLDRAQSQLQPRGAGVLRRVVHLGEWRGVDREHAVGAEEQRSVHRDLVEQTAVDEPGPADGDGLDGAGVGGGGPQGGDQVPTLAVVDSAVRDVGRRQHERHLQLLERRGKY